MTTKTLLQVLLVVVILLAGAGAGILVQSWSTSGATPVSLPPERAHSATTDTEEVRLFPAPEATSRASAITSSPAAASPHAPGSDAPLGSPASPDGETYQTIARNYLDRIDEIVHERELAGTANTIVKDLSHGPVRIEWPLGKLQIDGENQIRWKATRDKDGFIHIYDEVFDRAEYPELFALRDSRAEALARLADSKETTGGVTIVR